jgi:hypothetical protein
MISIAVREHLAGIGLSNLDNNTLSREIQNLVQDGQFKEAVLAKTAQLFVEREASQEGRYTLAFSENLNDQYRSSQRSRAVMLNLYILFSLGILGFYAFAPPFISNYSYISFVAVYVSMSAFIIYIYRSSNLRIATVLSVLEDMVRRKDVLNVLENVHATAKLNQNHVDVVRILSRNRTRQEREADHPYEIILRGVSNANILLKGGRVSTTDTQKR